MFSRQNMRFLRDKCFAIANSSFNLKNQRALFSQPERNSDLTE